MEEKEESDESNSSPETETIDIPPVAAAGAEEKLEELIAKQLEENNSKYEAILAEKEKNITELEEKLQRLQAEYDSVKADIEEVLAMNDVSHCELLETQGLICVIGSSWPSLSAEERC